MLTRYVATTRISRIEERWVKRRREGTTGIGAKADMIDVSTGWWIVTESPEPYAFCAGSERPSHAAGEQIRLIMEVGSK